MLNGSLVVLMGTVPPYHSFLTAGHGRYISTMDGSPTNFRPAGPSDASLIPQYAVVWLAALDISGVIPVTEKPSREQW